MPNNKSLYDTLVDLNEEINQQLIYTPNRFETLEDIFYFQTHHNEDRYRYYLYKDLNALFAEFLENEHCASPELLDETAKIKFKKIALNSVKRVRDELLRQKKYLSSKTTKEERETNGTFESRDSFDEEIKTLLTQNLDTLVDTLCRGKSLSIEDEFMEDRFKQIDYLISYREKYQSLSLSAITSGLENLQRAEDIEKKSGFQVALYLDRNDIKVGQCGEHASLALLKCYQRYLIDPNTKVERVVTNYFDDNAFHEDNHVFLVFNRDPNTTLEDISTWNGDTIFFDSWKKVVFKAKDYLSHRFIEYGGRTTWSSTLYTDKDYQLVRNIEFFETNLYLTDLLQAETFIAALKKENQLFSLENAAYTETKRFLDPLIASVWPEDFKRKVNVYVSPISSHLISILPGFSDPTIVINQKFLAGLNSCYTIDELKFALAETLHTIKEYGVGIIRHLNAADQYALDKQIIQKLGNATAAINYLRKAHQFKTEVKELKPVKFQALKNYAEGVTKSNYEQRIKNIMSALAAERLSSHDTMADAVIVPEEALHEVSNMAIEYFYKPELEQQLTLIKKIEYLRNHLSDLKEKELVAYEINKQASFRVQEFCKLLLELDIDLSQNEIREAVDHLIDDALRLRVPGFDHIYAAIFTVKKDRFFDRNTRFIPLGSFKRLDDSIQALIQSKSFDEALVNANNFLSNYTLLSDHLQWLDFSVALGKYLETYKKQHHGRLPSREDRFFGSNIGQKIDWHNFSENDREKIPLFIQWVTKDQSNKIAYALWLLGLNLIPEIIAKLSPEVLETAIVELKPYLVFGFEKALPEYSTTDVSERALCAAKVFSEKHKLRTEIFDGSRSLQDAIDQYCDFNWAALRAPGDQRGHFNSDNEAVHFLLTKFSQIARYGTDDEKKTVKSFFLNNDEKGLTRLRRNSMLVSKLSLNSHYLQFLFFNRYKDETFSLFTSAERIQAIRKFIFEAKFSLKDLLQICELPYENITLETLEALLPKIKDDLFFLPNDEFFAEYLSRHTIDCFSPESLRLIKLVTHYDCEKECLKQLSWHTPKQEQFSQLDVKDLVLLYRTFDQYFLFPSVAEQQKTGQKVFQRLMAIPTIEERIAAWESLLFTTGLHKAPLTDVQLKNNIIHQLVKDLVERYGCDDHTHQYFEAIKEMIECYHTNIMRADLELTLSRLADAINAQNEISELIGITLSPEKYLNVAKRSEHARQVMALSTLGKISAFLGDNVTTQEQTLDFISNPISEYSLRSFATYLVDYDYASHMHESYGNEKTFHSYTRMSRDDKIKQTIFLLNDFYYSFWNRPLDERAILIEYLTIPAKKTLSDDEIKLAYNETFDYVVNKLFPNFNTPDSEDAFAASFIKSYLNVADEYVRSLLLAGMIVVSNESQQNGQSISAGKKFVNLCEHLGPAYIKFAQAIHSHPNTPDSIKADLSHIKGRANPPRRWDLWRLLLDVLPDEDIKKIKHVGKLLGSASYNLALEVTLVDDRQVVLLLLRENAMEQANKGFEHLKAAILDCDHFRMDKLRDPAIMMLEEAKILSRNEVDHKISDKQNKIAHKMYSLPLSVNGYTVLMSPADTIKSGDGYRFIERMYGDEFNDLPDQTPHQREIKKTIAIAVVTVELLNILSGNYFDSDRHGNQLRVMSDAENKTIYLGLYDFGEMATENPSNHEIRQLANVLEALGSIGNVINFNKKSIGTVLDDLLSKHINQAIERGESHRYLMRVRKAMLALHDFQQYLSTDDFLKIFSTLINTHEEKIHPMFKKALTHDVWLMNTLVQTKNNLQKMFGFFAGNKNKDAEENTLEMTQLNKRQRAM